MGMIRIFIACADDGLRLALLMLLAHEDGMVIAGVSDRLSGLLAQLQGTKPDVLLLDWDVPVPSMAALLTKVHNLERRPKIFVFSNRPEEEERILAAGADYFICKDAPPDKLLPILKAIRLSNNSLIHKEK